MKQYQHTIGHANPVQPLTPREMVTDNTLRQLAKGDPDRQLGELTQEETALLAMVLPDICGELLAYRAMDNLNAIQRCGTPRNHAEEIVNAQAEFRSVRGKQPMAGGQ